MPPEPVEQLGRVSDIGCLSGSRNSALRRETVGAPKAEFGSYLGRRSGFTERG